MQPYPHPAGRSNVRDELADEPPEGAGEQARRTFLLLLGSGEFEPWTEAIERLAISRARSGDGSVLVVLTASSREGDAVFRRWGQLDLRHYRARGLSARMRPPRSREDAFDEDLVIEVGPPSLIFFSGFSGGRPRHLAETLEGTPRLGSDRAGRGPGSGLRGNAARGPWWPDRPRRRSE